MAKGLPPSNPALRLAYETVKRILLKAQTGKPLTATQRKSLDRNLAKLNKAGYSTPEIYASIHFPDADKPKFGLGDLTVGNPVDSAKFILEKTKVTAITDFLGKIGDPHTWLRVAFIILGGLFFLIGLGMLLKELGQGKLAKGVASAVPIVKAVAK